MRMIFGPLIIVGLLWFTVWWLHEMWIPCREHGHSFMFCAATKGLH